MTKKVTDKAFELLAKAVSDLEGNEKKVADALVAYGVYQSACIEIL